MFYNQCVNQDPGPQDRRPAKEVVAQFEARGWYSYRTAVSGGDREKPRNVLGYIIARHSPKRFVWQAIRIACYLANRLLSGDSCR